MAVENKQMTGLRRSAALAAALAAIALAAACGPATPSGGAASPATSRSAPAAPTPTPSPAPTAGPVACWPLQGGTEYPGGAPRPAVADVRAGAQTAADRLVIEFNGPGVPRYRLEANPTSPPGGTTFMTAGSGQAVTVQGAYGVLLTIQDLDWSRDVYPHGKDLLAGYAVLKEARVTGDFEAVVTIAVGLSRDACPTVTLLTGPPRLVIDFPTHS
jgi:hypothetical protein